MRSSKPLLLLAATSVLTVACVTALNAYAHGTMVKPHSRVFACALGNIENPTDPACKAAKEAGGTQAFYDWMSINQAAANDNHRAVVPDGKLCSGNNPTFKGLDLVRDDWQAQDIQSGAYEFQFRGTAPHATREWAMYITREGWNPNSPLRWNDLEHFCSVGNVPVVGGIYRLQCNIPQRSGRHVIYNTWQRSDSPEAFYTCMDVKFAGGSSGGTTPPPPSPWRDAGVLQVRGDYPAGTKVTLRTFGRDGGDIERIETVLGAGQTAAATWPGVVAGNVNSRSASARIGVLGSDGTVRPVAGTGNRVYLSGQSWTHIVDYTLPTTGGGGGQTPTPNPNPNPNPTPGGDFDYVYPAGIGRYEPGKTVVKAPNGKLYACRPFPEGGWCNINATAYVPGTGWAWQDAWIEY